MTSFDEEEFGLDISRQLEIGEILDKNQFLEPVFTKFCDCFEFFNDNYYRQFISGDIVRSFDRTYYGYSLLRLIESMLTDSGLQIVKPLKWTVESWFEDCDFESPERFLRLVNEYSYALEALYYLKKCEERRYLPLLEVTKLAFQEATESKVPKSEVDNHMRVLEEAFDSFFGT